MSEDMSGRDVFTLCESRMWGISSRKQDFFMKSVLGYSQLVSFSKLDHI